MTITPKGDGLLRLSYALASNNQHKENDDLMAWLETATTENLRLAFPVLLNWCRNSLLQKTKSKASAENDDDDDDSEPVLLTTTTTTEQVVERIVTVLENAIEYDAQDTMMNVDDDNNDDDNNERLLQKKNGSVSALRMALAGYLHTNHDKMRDVPAVGELEKRTKARVSFDRAATNTLSMVNAASPSNGSISRYRTPEEDNANRGALGNIAKLNIDLGLGLQSSPADVCEEYIQDHKSLLHPFTGEAVGRMHVKKVFPSKRKPVWIEYYSSTNSRIRPDVLAKQGDDLRNDFSVTTVSKLCENIWAVAPIEWTLGEPPTVCAYDVLVTAPDAGYLEMVPGKNFLDLSQKVGPKNEGTQHGGRSGSLGRFTLADLANRPPMKTGWEDVNVRKLAPSLVGSYIVNFVLGVRDRHEDNMMVVGDLQEDPKMMQIDFGYVLMEFPGGVHFDMPRLTMPIALVDRFNAEIGHGTGETATTLMEDLQHDMLAAYLVLRRHSSQFIPFCAHLMSSSYEYKQVEAVLRGKHVFRTDRSEKKVIKWMSEKLTTQWAHFYFRREVKQSMVSGYYKFVESVTFENKITKNDDTNDGSSTRTTSGSLGGKIRNFFGNRKSDTERTSVRSGSFDGDDDDDDGDDDDDDDASHHSVPDVVSPRSNSTRPVFKKSRSKKSFVFDTSDVDHRGDNSISDGNHPEDPEDMSELNLRVNDAMKLQKSVSKAMISQTEKRGTLSLDALDGGDDTGSVQSM